MTVQAGTGRRLAGGEATAAGGSIRDGIAVFPPYERPWPRGEATAAGAWEAAMRARPRLLACNLGWLPERPWPGGATAAGVVPDLRAVLWEAALTWRDGEAAGELLGAGLRQRVQDLTLSDPGAFRAILAQAFGGKADAAALARLEALAAGGELPLPERVRLVDRAVLGGADGAYSARDGGTVYLASDLRADPAALVRTFAEEAGHHLDAWLGGGDASGDEGAIFARGLLGGGALGAADLAAERADRDHGVITVDGAKLAVEFREPGETGTEALARESCDESHGSGDESDAGSISGGSGEGSLNGGGSIGEDDLGSGNVDGDDGSDDGDDTISGSTGDDSLNGGRNVDDDNLSCDNDEGSDDAGETSETGGTDTAGTDGTGGTTGTDDGGGTFAGLDGGALGPPGQEETNRTLADGGRTPTSGDADRNGRDDYAEALADGYTGTRDDYESESRGVTDDDGTVTSATPAERGFGPERGLNERQEGNEGRTGTTAGGQEPAAPEERGWFSTIGHAILDGLGLVPGVGEFFDGANAAWYAAEGDRLNAALSAAAMVPFAGMAATAGKWGMRAERIFEELRTGEAVAVTRITRKGEPGVRIYRADGSQIDITPSRVKEWYPSTHADAKPGTGAFATFENALPGSKGRKRAPTADDLEILDSMS